MRRSDEVHDRVRGGDRGSEGRRVQRIADHCRRARGDTSGGFGTHERANVVTTPEKRFDEASTDVSGRAGNKNVSWNTPDSTLAA